MNMLVISLILSVFFLDFLHFNVKILPRAATWLPDLLLLTAGGIVAFRISLKQYFDMDIKYIYCIALFILVIAFGTVLNNVGHFKLLVGARLHLKHLAIFLLPAVYRFNEKEFRTQLLVLLPLLLMQAPVAIFQKLYAVFALRKYSGDIVQGTLFSPNPLAVAMLCGIAVLFAFYLKREVSLRTFLLSSLCLFIPTTICESKATLVYLPIILILPPLLFGGHMKGSKKKAIIIASVSWIVCMSLFVPMYNIISSHEDRKDISNFQSIASGKYFSSYLYSGINEKHLLNNAIKGWNNKDGYILGQLRRIDQVAVAFKHLYDKSLFNLMTGDGVGITFSSYLISTNTGSNASSQTKSKYPSAAYITRNLTNINTLDLLPLTADVTVSILLWEVGIMGVFVYCLFFFLLFRDSIQLSRSSGMSGALGLGWCTVTVAIFLALGYFNLEHSNAINLLFWYFSGIVAARAFRLRRWNEAPYASGMHGQGLYARGKNVPFD